MGEVDHSKILSGVKKEGERMHSFKALWILAYSVILLQLRIVIMSRCRPTRHVEGILFAIETSIAHLK